MAVVYILNKNVRHFILILEQFNCHLAFCLMKIRRWRTSVVLFVSDVHFVVCKMWLF